MNIRRAEITDAAAISRLLPQLGYEQSAEQMQARIEELSATGLDAIFVADVDGAVAGVASVHVLPMFHAGGSIARLTALVVDDRARRSGVGIGLVRAAEAFAVAAGCERMELTSGDHRAGAHVFYETIGYQRVSQRFMKPLRRP